MLGLTHLSFLWPSEHTYCRARTCHPRRLPGVWSQRFQYGLHSSLHHSRLPLNCSSPTSEAGVMVYAYIRDMLGSKLGRSTWSPDSIFVIILSSSGNYRGRISIGPQSLASNSFPVGLSFVILSTVAVLCRHWQPLLRPLSRVPNKSCRYMPWGTEEYHESLH
jgi:hypothetical protein